MPLDPDVKAFLDMVEATGTGLNPDMPIEEMRQAMAAGPNMDLPREEVGKCENRTIPGPNGDIPVRVYSPVAGGGDQPLPCLVMIHGGGFALGTLDTFENTVRHLCNTVGAVVVDVDYRLAPEHPFPAGVDDCYAAVQWVADNAAELGIDPGRLAVSGASAGGNLTIVVCLLARERGGPKIAMQIPIVPSLTFEDEPAYPSRSEFGGEYYGLSTELINWFKAMYLTNGRDENDIRAAPVLAEDYKGLPPALVITAGCCPLRDEGKQYADRLAEDGVAVEYVCLEGASHASLALAGHIKVARRAVDLVAQALCDKL